MNMELIQVAKATQTQGAHGGAEKDFKFKTEDIEQKLIGEVSGNISLEIVESYSLIEDVDVALELKNDTTLADPFECILHGMHPRVTGKLWLYSVRVTLRQYHAEQFLESSLIKIR